MEQPTNDRREARRKAALARKRRHQKRMLTTFGSLILIMALLLIPICRNCGGEKITETQPQPTEPETSVTQPQHVPVAQATLLAVGDNLMHEAIVRSAQLSDGSYDFSPIYAQMSQQISQADLAILCQETILVENEEDTSNSLPYYGTTNQLAPAIAQAGFDVVAQATEHSYDMGMDAITYTKNLWSSLGVSTLGIHDSQDDAAQIVVREVNGIRIALLNYTFADNDTERPEQAYAVDYLENADAIAQTIALARAQADAVVVVAHWGEMTTYEANEFQKTWAQFFADHGIAAVIGSHPHTLQPVELLSGSEGNTMPVFYSLGNFMTDMSSNYNMLGGMAGLSITKDSLGRTYLSSYRLTPLMETIEQTEDGEYVYRVLPLADYTEDMASKNDIEDTGVDAMEQIYRNVIPTDVDVTLPAPEADEAVQAPADTSGSTGPTEQIPEPSETTAETE